MIANIVKNFYHRGEISLNCLYKKIFLDRIYKKDLITFRDNLHIIQKVIDANDNPDDSDILDSVFVPRIFRYLLTSTLYSLIKEEEYVSKYKETDKIRIAIVIESMKQKEEYKEIIRDSNINEKAIDSYFEYLIYNVPQGKGMEINKSLIFNRLFTYLTKNAVNKLGSKNNIVLFILSISLLLIDDQTKKRLRESEETNDEISLYWDAHTSLFNRLMYLNQAKIRDVRDFIRKIDIINDKMNFLDKNMKITDINDFYSSVILTISVYTYLIISNDSSLKTELIK